MRVQWKSMRARSRYGKNWRCYNLYIQVLKEYTLYAYEQFYVVLICNYCTEAIAEIQESGHNAEIAVLNQLDALYMQKTRTLALRGESLCIYMHTLLRAQVAYTVQSSEIEIAQMSVNLGRAEILYFCAPQWLHMLRPYIWRISRSLHLMTLHMWICCGMEGTEYIIRQIDARTYIAYIYSM